MATRSSLTQAAINKGWGMSWPGSLTRRSIHPEYLFDGPYGTVPTRHASRGGALIKGSAAAKAHMAYLRSLRRGGKRNTTRGGSYNMAALLGGDEVNSSMAAAIQRMLNSGKSLIEQKAKDKMKYYEDNPEQALQQALTYGKKYAPKVKNLFTKLKNWIKKKVAERKAKKIQQQLEDAILPETPVPEPRIAPAPVNMEEEEIEEVPPPLPPRKRVNISFAKKKASGGYMPGYMPYYY